jgi:hypothetical protein
VLVRSDNTIEDLHYTIQLAMGWMDKHLNCFTIHGKDYSVYVTEDSTHRVQTSQQDLEKTSRDRKAQLKVIVDENRTGIMEDTGVDLSKFVNASLHIALTEKYLSKSDLYTLIYDLAFTKTQQAAAALETIDRNLDRIALRSKTLRDLRLRKEYNVPENMSDQEFEKMLAKYRKAGLIPQPNEENADLKARTFYRTVREEIVSAARQSENQYLIPLLTRCLSPEEDAGFLASAAQNALDDLAAADAPK